MPQSELRPPDARPRVPVLVLGKGITALGAVRALGRRGTPLFVAGTPGSIVTGSRWYRRLPGEPLEEASDADLAARLRGLSIPRMVLLPCSDAWVVAVSRLPEDLRERFPASIAPTATLLRLTDKGRFAETIAELDLPRPRTFLLPDAAALDAVPAELFQAAFLKPVNSGPFASQYGVKAIRPRGREHARDLVAEAAGKGLELMLQEFIPGPPARHHFLDGFIDRRGRVCGLLARRRLRMFPPDFGNSTITESIPLEAMSAARETLLRLLRSIAYRGVFSAEFKLDDRDGLFKILEVNARPWWFVGFAAACGVDVCGMARRDALGEDVETVTSYRVGLRCVYARRDLDGWRAHPRESRPPLASVLRSWIGAQQLTFSLDDPRPGFREMNGSIRTKIRRRLGS
jgi:D-aspartate ligase